MKLIHLSDLHLGKRVNEFSMIEDQSYILDKIVDIIKSEKPNGVIIAGDVYDKASPSAEAVTLFDHFLTKLASLEVNTFVISGNHDSAERIAFGAEIMNARGIYLSKVYEGEATKVVLEDTEGSVNIYMLPFIKPANVRKYFEEVEIESYTDAMAAVIGRMNVITDERNVLITHQFVTGAVTSDSENVSVGGTDNVDKAVFEGFDYVALGHIHKPQTAGKETIRYCGTPLKYSFSESSHEKSVTVVTLGKKGDVEISTIPLKPRRDMKEIKGTYEEVTAKSFYEGTDLKDAYLRVTLTDEEDVPDALAKLRTIYHNIMKLDYDNARTRKNNVIDGPADGIEEKPVELFAELYEKQNNISLTDEQIDYITELVEGIWEDEI